MSEGSGQTLIVALSLLGSVFAFLTALGIGLAHGPQTTPEQLEEVMRAAARQVVAEAMEEAAEEEAERKAAEEPPAEEEDATETDSPAIPEGQESQDSQPAE